MNKKSRVVLIGLITIAFVLALTIPGLAKKPADFTLEYELPNVDWDLYYAEGIFSSEGEIEDQGPMVTHWTTNWTAASVKQGMMVFGVDPELPPNPDADTFAVKFSLSKIEGECAYGQFSILAGHGTGDYVDLWGKGDIYMCRPGWGDYVYGEMVGWVH